MASWSQNGHIFIKFFVLQHTVIVLMYLVDTGDNCHKILLVFLKLVNTISHTDNAKHVKSSANIATLAWERNLYQAL